MRLDAFTYRRLRVRVLDGPDRDAVADDVAGELSCGTAPGNHLVLTDPAVSRHHFVITATARGAHLRDFGSTNGVFLHTHRIESAWIEPGATLQVGGTTLRYEDGEAEVDAPLSLTDRFGRAFGRSVA